MKDAEEQLVVITRSPRRRRRLMIVVAFILLILASLSYYIGFSSAMQIQGDAREAKFRLKSELDELQGAFEQIRREAAQAKVAADIDRQATEKVRLLVRDLEQQIAMQKEEIAFYKGLMAPSEKEQGLSIRAWMKERTGKGRRYEFSLVVQQLAVVHKLLKGHMRVNVVGLQDGEQKIFALRDLSQQVTEEKIKLRFKYFQTIEGEIELPEGFEAQRVDVIAQSAGNKSAFVERSFDW